MSSAIMLRVFLRLFSLACVLTAQLMGQSVITTIAGTDWLFPTNPQPATSAPLGQTTSAVFDRQGNLYVAESSDNIVVRIANGILTVVAGNGVAGFSGEGGAATNASLNNPTGLAFDASGNLYISDTGNQLIRKVTTDGIIVTVAGTGSDRQDANFVVDGTPGTKATLSSPSGLAFDGRSAIYIAEHGGIRKLDVSGVISTFYTSPRLPKVSADTPPFVDTYKGIALDAAGNVYVTADTLPNDYFQKLATYSTLHRVLRFSPNADVTILVVGSDRSLQVIPTSSLIGSLGGIAIDRSGLLYVCETGFNRVFTASSTDGGLLPFAGTKASGWAGDGAAAASALLNQPVGIAIDNTGAVYIAEYERVRKVAQGVISTVAGNGQYRASGDLGPATSAVLNNPTGLALDRSGNLYIADTNNHRVRRVDSQGRITNVAGNGVAGFSADNVPATSAQLNSPSAITFDASGNLFIADTGNRRIRMVTPQGTISTVAGNGDVGGPLRCSNLPATTIPLISPSSLAVDSKGNLYVTDTDEICQIDVNGIIHPYSLAYFYGGIGPIAADANDNLYVGEYQEIDRLTQSSGFTQITDSRVNIIASALAFDKSGNLFFSGSNTNNYFSPIPEIGRVLRDGTVAIVAGGAQAYPSPFNGDGGPASAATLNNPQGLVVDSAGNISFADSGNNRIRKILAATPSVQATTDSLSFSGRAGGALPLAQTVTISGSIPLIGLTASATDDGGGWLSVSPSTGATPSIFSVTADPSQLSPGTRHGTVTIQALNAVPAVRTVSVTFNVTPGIDPVLAVDKTNLSFTFPQQAAPRSQTLTVSNAGDGPLDFTISASTTGGLLAISPAAGRATPSQPVLITITANPAGLAPGAYTGKITVAGAGSSIDVPVTITVSAIDTAILLSHTGLAFTAVQGGGVVPPQSFAILNIGRGLVSWSVTTSVFSNVPNWLSVTPSTGSTDAGSSLVPSVAVSVNPKGLAAGGYYGQVRVDAKGAANTPQVVTVFLDVRTPANDPGPTVQPSELVFTATAGAPSPGSQDLLVYNISPTPNTFRSSASVSSGGLWFVNRPEDATLSPDVPTRVVVQPLTTGLPPGVYRGNVTFQTAGQVRNVAITLIVAGAAGGSAAGNAASPGACPPTMLVPALQSLSAGFGVSAGWPVALVANVKDDCGNPLTTGQVTVSFSNGDPPQSMQSLKDGRWASTWVTSTKVTPGVTVKVDARSPDQLQGSRQVTGDLLSRQDPPTLDRASILNIANTTPFVPIAPGSIISISGQRLAEGQVTGTGSPLPTQLASAQVVIAGQAVPLIMVSDSQINAIVPFEVEVNTSQQLVILRGATASFPISLDVADAQPAVLTQPDVGATQGLIYAVRTAADGSTQQFLASPDTPAQAGDGLVIFCAGLGRVDPPMPSGVTLDPNAPPEPTHNPVQLTIDGMNVSPSFAGLSPGMVGVYQITATMPAGTSTGSAVLVSIAVAGQTSPSVTMAVQAPPAN